MSIFAVIVEGTVKPAGTLELNAKINLPADQVHVTVEPIVEPGESIDQQRFSNLMESIWKAQIDARQTIRTR